MDKINNFYTTEDYYFDFKIDGKLNKQLDSFQIYKMMDISENDDGLAANCSFIAEENQSANLKCKLNISEYKNQKYFLFKTSEISDEKIDIFIPNLDQVQLIKPFRRRAIFIWHSQWPKWWFR